MILTMSPFFVFGSFVFLVVQHDPVTRLAELVHRGDPLTRPEEEDPEAFSKVDNMILKYFFYYPEDFGLGGHIHDLEEDRSLLG